MAPLLTIAPVRPDMLQRLPAGAYTVAIGSDAAKLLDSIKAAARSLGGPDDFAETEASFKREYGIDLTSCIEGAFSGDAVVAQYPLAGTVEGDDLLVVLDDANGADPASVAAHLRSNLDRIATKEGEEKPTLAESDYNGAHIVELVGKSLQDFRRSFTSMRPDKMFNLSPFVASKTLAYATLGKVFLFSTSTELLHRAVDAYQGRGAVLSSDADFSGTSVSMTGSQVVVACSFSRLAHGIASSIRWSEVDKQLPPQASSSLQSVVNLGEQSHRPFVGTLSISKDGFKGKAFIPMDYDAVIATFGDSMKAAGAMSSPAPAAPGSYPSGSGFGP